MCLLTQEDDNDGLIDRLIVRSVLNSELLLPRWILLGKFCLTSWIRLSDDRMTVVEFACFFVIAPKLDPPIYPRKSYLGLVPYSIKLFGE